MIIDDRHLDLALPVYDEVKAFMYLSNKKFCIATQWRWWTLKALNGLNDVVDVQ